MNCEEARQRWHDRLDEGRADPALDRHLGSCEACRHYGRQMSLVVSALDDLHDETEAVTARPRPGEGGSYDHRRLRTWRLPGGLPAAIAAGVAVAIGASLYFADSASPPSSEDVSPAVQQGVVSRAFSPAREPSLGISLQGESAQSYLAVAGSTADSDVQMYWLYQSLGSSGDGM